MPRIVPRRNGPHGDPPSVSEAQGAWIALARQRGVSDKEFRLGVELWTHAGREPFQGQPRCWREDGGWAYRVWPRIEPRQDDPPDKQARALTKRMGCKRRKVEQALSGLCKKMLIRRVSRPGGRPGKRERFNRQAETILLVPDSVLKAANPLVSTTDSARSGQSDTHKRAEPNQLSHSTSLEKTNPPSIDTEPQPVGVGLDCFAGQADEPSEPAEPSDPACPVEVIEPEQAAEINRAFNDPNTPAKMRERGVALRHCEYEVARWKHRMGPLLLETFRPIATCGTKMIVEHNPNANSSWKFSHTKAPGLDHFQEWLRFVLAEPRWVVVEANSADDPRAEAIRARRHAAQQRHAWELQRAKEAERAHAEARTREMHLVEQLVSKFRVERKTAEGLYADHQREPQRIRQAMFEVEQAMKNGRVPSPAGLIVSKLNKAAKRSSPANAAKSDHWAD